MPTTHNLKLIDGQFTPAEAHQVISGLISSKINFHAIEAFSDKERLNLDIAASQQRVEELKRARTDLEKIVKRAAGKGKELKVKSMIRITFVDGK